MVLSFPQASVTVKITVVLPVAPQSSLRLTWLFVHVTSLHTSVAAAPPKLSNQACNAAEFPAPSHSTVSSLASISIVGGVVSSIVIVACVVLSSPQLSVAVKVTVTAPVAPQAVFSELGT